MKKYKLIILALVMTFISLLPLDAASFSMTSSKKQVAPNGTFTIKVGGDCIGRVNLSVINGTLSESSVWVEQGYVNVTVKAGTSGAVSITASPVTGFSDSDANMYNPGTRTVTVNISTNTSSSNIKKSNNNNLSSLTVSVGELSPTFDSKITEYTLNLEAQITSITLNGKTSDSKAKVEGFGEISLHPGNNEINVTVTAEDGTKKTYKILAYVDETPQVYLDYKKDEIGIVTNYEGLTLPEGFVKEEQKLNDKTIFIFKKDNINLIYGINQDKEKNFYLFDKEKGKILNKITVISILNKEILIIDSKINGNLTETLITINDKEITAYKYKDKENYYIFNALNNEGKTLKYLYESNENNIIQFPEFLLETNKSNLKNIIICILSSLLLISLTLLALIFLKNKKGGKNEKIK